MIVLAALPVDVLDQILTWSPDFATLAALTATCRALRDVYAVHAPSTRRAVAANLCGPVWPRALLAVHAGRARDAVDAEVRARTIEWRRARAVADEEEYDSEDDEYWDEDEDEDEDDEDDEDDNDGDDGAQSSQTQPRRPLRWITPELPSEDDMRMSELPLTDMRELDTIGQAAQLLERVFSQRFRDMTAPGSVLSPAETELFYSGLYLHEVFARAFGQRVGQRADMPARDWRSRKDAELEFLDAYTTPELSALRAVRLLAADVQEWVARAASYRDFGSSLATHSLTLPMLVRLFRHPVSHRTEEWPHRTYEHTEDPFTKICERRSLKPDTLALDTIGDTFGTPASNLCDHCHAYSGVRLYTEPTWHYVDGDLPMHRIQATLPGHLRYNEYLRGPIEKIWNDHGLSSGAVVRSMFALGDDGGGGWDVTNRMCVDCVHEFVKDHIVPWCRHELLSRGMIIPDDNCWYGWNCRTQTHKRAHAEKLNHLCVPTK